MLPRPIAVRRELCFYRASICLLSRSFGICVFTFVQGVAHLLPFPLLLSYSSLPRCCQPSPPTDHLPRCALLKYKRLCVMIDSLGSKPRSCNEHNASVVIHVENKSYEPRITVVPRSTAVCLQQYQIGYQRDRDFPGPGLALSKATAFSTSSAHRA